MNQQPPIARRPLVVRDRWILAILGFGGLGLLITAASLRPDDRGLGTHEQLGLPPCTFMSLLGVRCPSCGMTTSWSELLHGNVESALRASVSGTLLALLTMAGSAILLGSAISGRWWLPHETVMVTGALGLIAVILAEWLVRLAAG